MDGDISLRAEKTHSRWFLDGDIRLAAERNQTPDGLWMVVLAWVLKLMTIEIVFGWWY